MNTDLLTEDLKKKRASNESFWLMGQPEAEVRKQGGDYVVEVMGFDYFNVEKGEIVSGGKHNIAMWMLDADYDGRSLYPDQVFFPIAGEGQGWARLARNLKASARRGTDRQVRRHRLAAVRGRQVQAGGGEDRRRPRHREPQAPRAAASERSGEQRRGSTSRIAGIRAGRWSGVPATEAVERTLAAAATDAARYRWLAPTRTADSRRVVGHDEPGQNHPPTPTHRIRRKLRKVGGSGSLPARSCAERLAPP
ncbi:MAG: hypothetical protein MZV70_46815 [Desulfobacterales bacterium]|nr:hypothetical protein [Desulfobacterales bacterium]